MIKIISVSDLHIDAPYCYPEDDYIEKLYQALEDADHCVLNGDIFEYRYRHKSAEEVTEKAMEWLSQLAERFPQTEFHFIMGNHDNVDLLAGALQELENSKDNFDWNASYKIIGDVLFTHSDIQLFRKAVFRDSFKTAEDAVVPDWRRDIESVNQLAALYITDMIYPIPKLFDKVLDPFIKEGILPSNITDIAIGHAHKPAPVVNYEHRDIRFHISGCAVRGSINNMLEFELDDDGKCLNVKGLNISTQVKEPPGNIIKATKRIATLDVPQTIKAILNR